MEGEMLYGGFSANLNEINDAVRSGEGPEIVVACLQGKGRSPEWANLFNNALHVKALALDGGLRSVTGNTEAVKRMAAILSQVPIVVVTINPDEQNKPDVSQAISAVNRVRNFEAIVIPDDQGDEIVKRVIQAHKRINGKK